MPSGRLSTWTPEYSKSAEAYIQSFIDQTREEDGYNAQVLPSIAGLALELNVSRSTLYSWANNEETGFSGILGRLNKLQEGFLLNNGLNGKYNSAIAKLVLGKHGYKEEKAVTGANDEPLIPKDNMDTIRRMAFVMAQALRDEDEKG